MAPAAKPFGSMEKLMLFWLMAAIAVYYVQVFLPATFKFLKLGPATYLGKRDTDPELTGAALRVERATRNMHENFPPFAALAVAALAMGQGENASAILGAQIFVIGRALYIPLYAAGVPVVRSLAAVAGWVGMIMIAVALLGTGSPAA